MDNQTSQPLTPNNKSTLPPSRNIMNRLLLALLGLFLIVLAVATVYGLTHKQSTTNKTNKVVSSSKNSATTDYDNSSYSAGADITISSSGFTPEAVNVSPNTSVTIRNTDTVNHTIMLNNPDQKDGPQSSDDDNPNLPNNALIVPSDAVAHVFQKSGTYLFHDLANPTENLTVVVK